MINIAKSRLASMNIQYKYYPLKKFLDDAADCGLSCVELWGAAPHFHFEDLTYRDIQKVRREIETRGLTLVCYTPEQCVYPINMAAETESERRRSLKFFEDSVRAASELGTDKMLVTTGWGYFDDSNREEAWKHAREGIFDLAELGQAHGVQIALEVLRTDESNLVNNLPSLSPYAQGAQPSQHRRYDRQRAHGICRRVTGGLHKRTGRQAHSCTLYRRHAGRTPCLGRRKPALRSILNGAFRGRIQRLSVTRNYIRTLHHGSDRIG